MQPFLARALLGLGDHLDADELVVAQARLLRAQPLPLAATGKRMVNITRSDDYVSEREVSVARKLLARLLEAQRSPLRRAEPVLPDFERLRRGDQEREARGRAQGFPTPSCPPIGSAHDWTDHARREAYYARLLLPSAVRPLSEDEAQAMAARAQPGATKDKFKDAMEVEWTTVSTGPTKVEGFDRPQPPPRTRQEEFEARPRVPSNDLAFRELLAKTLAPEALDHYRHLSRVHQIHWLPPLLILGTLGDRLPQASGEPPLTALEPEPFQAALIQRAQHLFTPSGWSELRDAISTRALAQAIPAALAKALAKAPGPGLGPTTRGRLDGLTDFYGDVVMLVGRSPAVKKNSPLSIYRVAIGHVLQHGRLAYTRQR